MANKNSNEYQSINIRRFSFNTIIKLWICYVNLVLMLHDNSNIFTNISLYKFHGYLIALFVYPELNLCSRICGENCHFD